MITYDCTLEQIKPIIEKFKKHYKFGTSKCPAWLKSVGPAMQQDKNYAISVCIPNLQTISDDERNSFSDGFEGVQVQFRVVTESLYKKPEPKHEDKSE